MLILRLGCDDCAGREVGLRHLNERACNRNYWAYSKDSSGAERFSKAALITNINAVPTHSPLSPLFPDFLFLFLIGPI